MKIIEREFVGNSRKQEITIFALGDVHLGAVGCAEKELINLVNKIKNDPTAYWIGGGDMLDAVIINDAKRFDTNTLPDWMLEGSAEKIKGKLGDILKAQQERFIEIVKPIKDKCLGLLEGNHEYTIYKHHNRDIMTAICTALDVENLTDCAFIRLRFIRQTVDKTDSSSRNVTMFICHGKGSGISPGSEPNKLYDLAADKDVDIVLTGHTHSFCILTPISVMTIPARGDLPKQPITREKYAANWGSFMRSYVDGPSTYVSRGLFPSRPLYTVEVKIIPHKTGRELSPGPEITLSQYRLV